MPEENKKNELKEAELKNANGGYSQETVYTIYSGECYSDQSNIYKVIHNNIRILQTDFVECETYFKNPWVKHQQKKQSLNISFMASHLITMNYEGVNYI